jgi:tellurite resistance protein
MVAIAGADGRLVESETDTIRRLYQRLTGDEIEPVDVAHAMEARAASSLHLTDLLKSRRGELDMTARESLLKAAYLVLMSDKRVAARERKKLHDYAKALEIPEIHLTAILEDLSPLSE